MVHTDSKISSCNGMGQHFGPHTLEMELLRTRCKPTRIASRPLIPAKMAATSACMLRRGARCRFQGVGPSRGLWIGNFGTLKDDLKSQAPSIRPKLSYPSPKKLSHQAQGLDLSGLLISWIPLLRGQWVDLSIPDFWPQPWFNRGSRCRPCL